MIERYGAILRKGGISLRVKGGPPRKKPPKPRDAARSARPYTGRVTVILAREAKEEEHDG